VPAGLARRGVLKLQGCSALPSSWSLLHAAAAARRAIREQSDSAVNRVCIDKRLWWLVPAPGSCHRWSCRRGGQ
jgi:hypothetical protein